MPEYIEREALLKEIDDKQTEGYGLCMLAELKAHYVAGLHKAKQFVEKAPAADVVEVVRCKDCLFSIKDCDYGHGHGYMCYKGVYHPCIGETRHRKLVQDIDFCSHGVRKEGAG